MSITLVDKINDGSIMVYNDENILEKYVNLLYMSICEAQTNYIYTLVNFINDIKQFQQQKLLNLHISNMKYTIIVDHITTNQTETISRFIKYVYNNNIRQKIIDEDETFFINNTESVNDDIFIFKKDWYNISDQIKDYIKMNLKTIIEYTDIIYINTQKYNKIKTINSRYSELFEIYDRFIM